MAPERKCGGDSEVRKNSTRGPTAIEPKRSFARTLSDCSDDTEINRRPSDPRLMNINTRSTDIAVNTTCSSNDSVTALDSHIITHPMLGTGPAPPAENPNSSIHDLTTHPGQALDVESGLGQPKPIQSRNLKLRSPVAASSSVSTKNSLTMAKVILTGDAGTGKTTFLKNFAKLIPGTTVTSDSAHVTKIIQYGGRDLKLDLIDTTGQERYRSMTASYYRNANGCLLLFRLSQPRSFYSLSSWLEDIDTYCMDEDISTVLVGLKSKDDAETVATSTSGAGFAGIRQNHRNSATITTTINVPAINSNTPNTKNNNTVSSITSEKAKSFADNHCLSYVETVDGDLDSIREAVHCVLDAIAEKAKQKASWSASIVSPHSQYHDKRSRRLLSCCPC